MMLEDPQIKKIVKETIRELIQTGFLKPDDKQIPGKAAEILIEYYRTGETDGAINAALQQIRGDYYFKVIPLYYKRRKKNEQIAEYYNVDISTITRNKRRLSIKFYNALQELRAGTTEEKTSYEIKNSD